MARLGRNRSVFDDLPAGTLGSPDPPPRGRRHWARHIELVCCLTLAYFPLLFVYGLATWAVWVEVNVSLLVTSISSKAGWKNYAQAALGVALYALQVGCYTVAVFTSPGSPLDERRDASQRSRGGRGGRRAGYEGLPTYEHEDDEDGEEEHALPRGMTTVTAKSDGKPRYCKKCQTTKPDRAHHCSTCRRCVLKMDHHCPWLATCVGLRNYKAFLLFLIYTSLFCWMDFAVTATWVWAEILDEVPMQEGMMVVNVILLAVLGGIIGLVISGFAAWHIYLACTGQTTIESLEKTRYLAPVRKSMSQQLQQQQQSSERTYVDEETGADAEPQHQQTLTEHLKEIHANALPGVLRPEEGELSGSNTPLPANHSPAQRSLTRSYASLEAQREQDRYTAYLDELDSEKMPNAFNLGWKRNLLHVFGAAPLVWWLPVCNTSGDGWCWEVSPKWTDARDRLARERAAREREEAARYGGAPAAPVPSFEPPRRDYRWAAGQAFVNQAPSSQPHGYGGPLQPPPRSSSTQGLYEGRQQQQHQTNGMDGGVGGHDMQMQPLDRRKAPANESDGYDTSSSDEEVKRMYSHPQIQGTGDWNDVPEDFLPSKRDRGRAGRRKGD